MHPNPFIEAKKILLKAQAGNTNEWYGQQFQKGLDEIGALKNHPDISNILQMRCVPQIILSLSEVAIMLSEKDPKQIKKFKIVVVQKMLWKYHKDPTLFDNPDLWE